MRRFVLALLLSSLAAAAAAQTFPARPVTLLITFPAGGPTDIAGRALAEATSKYLGQQVLVENRPGATGTLCAAALVNAKTDGYLVSMIPITVLRLPHMENVAYDPMKDISYVMGVSGYVFAYIVRSDSPWKSMGDLIAAAKAKPGEISYGSHGIGGSVHLATEELAAAQGVKMNHVPFKGSADMLTAMLGGHLNVAVDSTGAVPHVSAGKARVLAVLTEKRTPVWPDVPTLTELGYGIVSTSPYGISVPAATPPAVVKALHDAFRKGLEDPIHTKTLEKYNQPVWYLSSEDYTKWAKEQYEKERKIINSLGLAKKK